MNLENYKSGSRIQGIGYKYFMPNKINSEWGWSDSSISLLLEKASFELGQLNSFARLVPNIDLFIHLHVTKEAVVSSRIEGTQTKFDEALLKEENIKPERKDDWIEVQNYTKALNNAVENLSQLPLSSRLIRKSHFILMQGVRGERKTPGEFRRSQNWIGGANIQDAAFIPPHQDYVDELMGDLESFLHNPNTNLPILIKAAIAHYQFETIHPFLDGNGRIGRLLITLYLIEAKILNKPLLYLSHFFEKEKSLYYDNLTRVRTHHDLAHWIKYFLVGVQETATQATATLSKVIELKKDTEEHIQKTYGKKVNHGLILMNKLFEEPIITIKEVQSVCSLSAKSAGDLVDDFVKSNILKEMTGQYRHRIYEFEKYLSLFSS